ncbi:hypothetical protein [Bacillus subtilis]|uniref:hypothetical protein n=1 Tax=Bacillus subtilis TaxID=1423 RepID=UPI0021DA9F5B|nr:hypothetical protein [Bacillus subtilis]
MTKTSEPKEVLGIFITKNEISNLNIEHIHVTDYAIQTILKTVRLNEEVQKEVVDKMVDRTPDFFKLSHEEQVNKIKTVLTFETVIEYLRLNDYIHEGIDMIETGIDNEGSIVVSAFYANNTEITDSIFANGMTEEEVNQMEKDFNVIDSSINIVEEAKKKMESMKNVVPFENRATRRLREKNEKQQARLNSQAKSKKSNIIPFQKTERTEAND